MDKLDIPNRTVHYEWRNKPETCTIGGKTHTYKGQGERKWALYLQMLKELGAITDWWYESEIFHFKERYSMKHTYTLDFKVLEDGQFVYYEYKNCYIKQKDVSRLRRMAKDFRDIKIILVVPNPIKNKHKSKATMKQHILRERALQFVEKIIYCNPLFRKFSIK